MKIREQIIRDRAFVIFTDAVFAIKPAARPCAIRWLEQAQKWAAKNNAPELLHELEGYLAKLDAPSEYSPIESDPALVPGTALCMEKA